MVTIAYTPSGASIITRRVRETAFLNADTQAERWFLLQEILNHIDTMEEVKYYSQQRREDMSNT
jgi:hypothetical protein